MLSVIAGLAVTLAAGPSTAGRAAEVRYDGAMLAPGLVADRTHHARHAGVVTANGGQVVSLSEGGERFLRFPPGSCPAPPCPQAVVQPAASQALTPLEGTGRFSFGAAVRLTSAPPSGAGMNVWQYGLAGPGHGQWKLQVDDGYASCRWSDGTAVVLLPARAYRLAVGRWHLVRCARLSRTLFEIRVLDRATRALIVPPVHTVAPMGRIRPHGLPTIGGKRVRPDQTDAQTDQFRGDLDDVHFRRE